MTQLTLFDCQEESKECSYLIEQFSADCYCPENERGNLEKKYASILEVTSKFDRRSVSNQLSKKECLHRWLRYKEGFSPDLVNHLLDEMQIRPGDVIMDPFMGSGTTSLVCQTRGINSMGYDIMPFSPIAIRVKSNAAKYRISEIKDLMFQIRTLTLPDEYRELTPSIVITEDAYPIFNGKFIRYITDWILHSSFSKEAKDLFVLCMINSLELCSYTSKSGQYLRWDSRSQKVKRVNDERLKQGKKPFSQICCRDKICNIRDEILRELNLVLNDIMTIQLRGDDGGSGQIDFKQGSVLFELPKINSSVLNGVITSPPYCNRYDYTRTYALELVYLGMDESQIKELRQRQLSCTVESKNKIGLLREFYSELGEKDRFEAIYETIQSNKVLAEVLAALNTRNNHGDINNRGVIRMVEGYFTELAFIYAELFRICKKGAVVAFVNDNVRYGGEVIPVDFMSTDLAESFGFTPLKVYCLKQQKGNSSQQMKRFGRVPLRKSITLWKKE